MKCAKEPHFKPPSVLTYTTAKKRGSDKAVRSIAQFYLLKLREILDCTHHLAGIAVLVVVPRNNLYLGKTVADRSNHGLSFVED